MQHPWSLIRYTTLHFYSGSVSPSQIEPTTSPVNNLIVVGVDTNAYRPARCVFIVDAETSRSSQSLSQFLIISPSLLPRNSKLQQELENIQKMTSSADCPLKNTVTVA